MTKIIAIFNDESTPLTLRKAADLFELCVKINADLEVIINGETKIRSCCEKLPQPPKDNE